MNQADSRKRSLVLIGLGLAVYAGLSLASGLDRLALMQPSLARLVPAGIAANSPHIVTLDNLRTNEIGRAVEMARHALSATPAEDRGPANLGLVRMAQSNEQGAAAAFAVARKLSNRNAPALLDGIVAAREQDDENLASRYFQALVRVRADSETTARAFEVLTRSASGRQALAQSLFDDANWSHDFLDAASGWPSDPVASFLDDAIVFERTLGCTAINDLVRGYVAIGQSADARSVWLRQCPAAQQGELITDSDFAALGEGADSLPLGWQRSLSGDIRLRHLEARGGALLEATNAAAVSRMLIAQPTALDAGEYALLIEQVSDPERLFWQLDCTSGEQARSIGGPGGSAQIRVPADCENQLLSLWVTPGDDPVRFSRVAIEALD